MELLQCSDCNFAIKRTHHRLFLEYVLKTSCFKNNILRKKSTVDQRLNKAADLQYTILNFFQKSGAHVRPACRSTEDSNIFIGKPLWSRPFFTKNLEFISAISLKKTPTQSVSYMGSAQKLFLDYQDIFKKRFLTKWQVPNLQVATLLKTCLTKIYKIFNGKGDLYCVKTIFVFEC